jgi:hypothetical protein
MAARAAGRGQAGGEFVDAAGYDAAADGFLLPDD